MNDTIVDVEVNPLDSVLGEIAARRSRLQAQSVRDFPIPGYDGRLVAKFQSMGWHARKQIELDGMRRAQEGVARGGDPDDKLLDAEFRAQVEFLAAACIGMHVSTNGELVKFADGFDPVAFERIIGVLVDEPTHVIVGLFPEPNDFLVEDLATSVKDWMDDVEGRFDRESGESLAAAGA